MHIVKLTDVESQPVAMEGVVGATRQVPLGVAHGVPTMSARVFTLEPGGHTPHHEHPFEHLNYVISGRGELQSAQGPVSLSDFKEMTGVSSGFFSSANLGLETM